MTYRLSWLLLLLVAVFTHAADEEVIRLKDGRVLHGLYDEAAGTIAVAGPDGKSSATIRVNSADIVSRTSLEKKEPERNFVQEAATLEQRMQAEKVEREARAREELEAERKAKAEADRQLAERQEQVRQQLAADSADRERQSAQAVARAKSEAETEAQRIALMRDLTTLRVIEQKEIDRAQAEKAAARRVAERKAFDEERERRDSERKQRDAEREDKARQARTLQESVSLDAYGSVRRSWVFTVAALLLPLGLALWLFQSFTAFRPYARWLLLSGAVAGVTVATVLGGLLELRVAVRPLGEFVSFRTLTLFGTPCYEYTVGTDAPFVMEGHLSDSGKQHGRWTINDHYQWYWYGEKITEGDWHLRNK